MISSRDKIILPNIKYNRYIAQCAVMSCHALLGHAHLLTPLQLGGADPGAVDTVRSVARQLASHWPCLRVQSSGDSV